MIGHFAAKHWRGHFADAHWFSAESAVVVVPDGPGLEYTLPINRARFALEGEPPHYLLPVNRMHYTLPREQRT